MPPFKDFFSTTRARQASKADCDDQNAQHAQDHHLSGAQGPETMPVKMNLDERMAFRRELLFETIRSSLQSRFIAANTYRFKVMRTDKRGHCFIVMLDMSPTFMDSPAGNSASLKETANLLIKNAETKYGLQVAGVYWRSDETLDVTVASWARPSKPAALEPSTNSAPRGTTEKVEVITSEELAEFEAAWPKDSAIRVGGRSYASDLAPLMDEPQK